MTDPAEGPDRPVDRPTPPAPATAPSLDRAPGERYRARASVPGPSAAAVLPGTPTRAVLAGFLAAVGGALAYAVLGQVALGPGLIAVAAFVGWIVGIGIAWGSGAARPVRRSQLVAGALGAAAIVVGLLLVWAWSRVEGGVLGPLEYTDARYGPLAWLEVAVAGLVAAVRGR